MIQMLGMIRSRIFKLTIGKILVACYSTLLAFYSKVMAFLLEESRIRRALETFHSEIPRMVSDFNGHTNRLSNMIEVETLVTARKIWDQQIENFSAYYPCENIIGTL